MADLELVSRLRSEVSDWNYWKSQNRSEELNIDLSDADLHSSDLYDANLSDANLSGANLSEASLLLANLSGANLSGANLSDADLRSANLSGANLSGANLHNADLHSANLSGANLSEANLHSANLHSANLSDADLSEANLRRSKLIDAGLFGAVLFGARITDANLSGANLSEADLSGARLIKSNLSKANLSGADLFGANLVKAQLIKSNLSGARLIKSNLSEANLSEANLSGANLSEANLSGTSLVLVQAVGTDFTGAILTGACIKDWHITYATKLDKVQCEYVYREEEEQERRPIDPNKNYVPGEFTKLFQEVQNTIELVFNNGINWRAFAYAFYESNLKVYNTEGGELFLRELKVLDDGLIVLNVTIPPSANPNKSHEQLFLNYEKQIARLEGKNETKDEMLLRFERLLLPGIRIEGDFNLMTQSHPKKNIFWDVIDWAQRWQFVSILLGLIIAAVVINYTGSFGFLKDLVPSTQPSPQPTQSLFKKVPSSLHSPPKSHNTEKR